MTKFGRLPHRSQQPACRSVEPLWKLEHYHCRSRPAAGAVAELEFVRSRPSDKRCLLLWLHRVFNGLFPSALLAGFGTCWLGEPADCTGVTTYYGPNLTSFMMQPGAGWPIPFRFRG